MSALTQEQKVGHMFFFAVVLGLVCGLVVLVAQALGVGVKLQAPAPCARCLALGERTWFMGEVDEARPYDGILLTAYTKKPDGSMVRSVKRFKALSFTEAQPSAKPTAPTTMHPAAAEAVAQGKKDLAGATRMVKP